MSVVCFFLDLGQTMGNQHVTTESKYVSFTAWRQIEGRSFCWPSSNGARQACKKLSGPCKDQSASRPGTQVYEEFAPHQFLAYWFELWQEYQQLLGPIAELDAAHYSSFTGRIRRARNITACGASPPTTSNLDGHTMHERGRAVGRGGVAVASIRSNSSTRSVYSLLPALSTILPRMHQHTILVRQGQINRV